MLNKNLVVYLFTKFDNKKSLYNFVNSYLSKKAGVNQSEIVSDNKQTILPKYSIEDLELKLKKAVDKEEYEKAAKIRDKIKD